MTRLKFAIAFRLKTVGADSTEGSLLEQTEALNAALRDAQTKANELVAALRKHKKQTKLMESTLASQRQFQELDV